MGGRRLQHLFQPDDVQIRTSSGPVLCLQRVICVLDRQFIADRAERYDLVVLGRLRALQRIIVGFTAVTGNALVCWKNAFPIYVQPHREVGLAAGIV